MKRSRKAKKRLYTRVVTVPSVRSSLPARKPPPPQSLDALGKRRLARARVSADVLRWKCNPSEFPFRDTRKLAPLRGWIGQSQALRSLRLGLSVKSRGYNIFVCGLSGTDAFAALERYVRSLPWPRRPNPDRCYVQNFLDPQRPRLLELPPGEGARLQREIHRVLRRINRALEKKPEKGWKPRAQEVLDRHVPALLKAFQYPRVRRWIRQWQASLLQNIHHALVEDYQVNVLRRAARSGVPVVTEKVPTPANLFGWVGRRSLGDQAPTAHFTEIRGGALLEADGGILLVSASDFYSAPGSWGMLKACLKYGTLLIEEVDAQGSARAGGLKPDPIPVNVKVILVGDYLLYDDLFESDPDFVDTFKVRVDFDSEVTRTSRVLKREYPALIARICAENGLRPVDSSGVARVLEFAARRGGQKSKVTTQFWVIADLVREANYWAGVAGRSRIAGRDVEKAVVENVLRLNLVETKISEMIQDGTILITTSGMRIGQVNGLAIYDMGDYLFGRPSRITAETSYGQGGIINIERESGLSGRSHDKGVQILSGYLRSRFAQHRPLNLTASVCFEQSYSGVDGDSASAAEIYAILSSLGRLPVRQDIAVTGSLNQKGDIQPIGGANEKIEGFFDCVRASRPTGREGVIVPRKNLKDLVLRDDVVRAVRQGKFHIYAIDTVEEGFEILTGVRAGRRHRGGRYPARSAFHIVDERLEEMANGLRQYQGPDEG